MGKNFLKKFISLLKSENMKLEKRIIINAPVNSTDHQFDDFLGNTLQYKIDGHCIYDTKVSLPNEELEIVNIHQSEQVVKVEIKYYK